MQQFKYFFNLRILKESEGISDCDLEAYINYLGKLREDLKMVDYGYFRCYFSGELIALS